MRDPGISGLNSHPDLGICENRIPLFFGIYYINQSNEFKAKNVNALERYSLRCPCSNICISKDVLKNDLGKSKNGLVFLSNMLP